MEDSITQSLLTTAMTGDEVPNIAIAGVNHAFESGAFRNQVLFDCRLMLMPRELVIMTGPSGSGKTTLLTLIGGLRTVQEGSLRVLGKELRGLDVGQRESVRRQIGFIFQAHNLFGSLTAYQNVKLALQLRKPRVSPAEERELITAMLTKLGLGNRIHYKPDSLSGGQRQRVAIARSLVNEPRIVLADEPTAALDKESGRVVVDLLRTFADERNATVLIVTHDNRILDVADRIVNMVDGRVIGDVFVNETVTICEFLSRCPIFGELSAVMLSEVAKMMRVESVAANATIFRQGDIGDKFYLVRTGQVSLTSDDSAVQLHDTEVGTNEMFGEVALMTDQPRSANAIAKTDCTLYTLDKANFQRAMNIAPNFTQQVRQAIFSKH